MQYEHDTLIMALFFFRCDDTVSRTDVLTQHRNMSPSVISIAPTILRYATKHFYTKKNEGKHKLRHTGLLIGHIDYTKERIGAVQFPAITTVVKRKKAWGRNL